MQASSRVGGLVDLDSCASRAELANAAIAGGAAGRTPVCTKLGASRASPARLKARAAYSRHRSRKNCTACHRARLIYALVSCNCADVCGVEDFQTAIPMLSRGADRLRRADSAKWDFAANAQPPSVFGDTRSSACSRL